MTEESPRNRPTWDALATHPDLAQKLDAALREIFDPEIGLNLIQLGLIRNLRIENNQAELKMILTTPFCPYGPSLIDAAHQKAEAALGMPVLINLGMDAWDFSMMEEGLGEDWGLY